jgi:hypothetical protein
MEVERDLKRYERLRDAAGLDCRLIEEPARLLAGPFAPVQAAAEAAAGLAPALFGLLTSAVPYFATKRLARRLSRRQGSSVGLSLNHMLIGAVMFPIAYGLEVAVLSRSGFSRGAIIVVAALLVPCGLFAWVWTRRMRKLAVHVGGRAASWLKLDDVARVGEARRQLIARMDRIRERYRTEVLGWNSVASGRNAKRIGLET